MADNKDDMTRRALLAVAGVAGLGAFTTEADAAFDINTTATKTNKGQLHLDGPNIYFIIPKWEGERDLWIGCNAAHPNAPFLMATYAALGKDFTIRHGTRREVGDRLEAGYIGVTFNT